MLDVTARCDGSLLAPGVRGQARSAGHAPRIPHACRHSRPRPARLSAPSQGSIVRTTRVTPVCHALATSEPTCPTTATGHLSQPYEWSLAKRTTIQGRSHRADADRAARGAEYALAYDSLDSLDSGSNSNSAACRLSYGYALSRERHTHSLLTVGRQCGCANVDAPMLRLVGLGLAPGAWALGSEDSRVESRTEPHPDCGAECMREPIYGS